MTRVGPFLVLVVACADGGKAAGPGGGPDGAPAVEGPGAEAGAPAPGGPGDAAAGGSDGRGPGEGQGPGEGEGEGEGSVADPGAGWTDDGWRPAFAGQGGCPGAHHPDPDTGECRADHPERLAAEQDCWNGGQVAPDGVGRPCHPDDRPCAAGDGEGAAAFAATCCMVDAKLYGAQCVKPCRRTADCGPGQWCHRDLGVCMRGSCEALLTEWYDAHRYDMSRGVPCPPEAPDAGAGGAPGAANDTGVGATCTRGGGECVALDAANECLGTVTDELPAGVPSFCTFTCAVHEECGAGASCHYGAGPPFFCVPDRCAALFRDRILRRHPHERESPCFPEQWGGPGPPP